MDLHKCCRTNNLIELRRILEHRDLLTINGKDSYGRTALHDASYYGNLDILRELIKNGASLNEKSNIGNTPLHLAADWGHLEIVHELVISNACCTETNNNGTTPLHFASAAGRLDIIKELIDYSDRAIKDNRGQSALDVASTKEIRDFIANYVPLPEIKDPGFN